MRVLAFDVAISGCSVSFLDTDTAFSCQKRVETDRGQAELLIPMIGEVVAEAGLAMKDLGCIAVTRGPGSFTGVRIGLSTARSLGLALDIPVYGFSTLDVIKRSAPDKANALYLIDTKRGDFYGQTGDESPRIWTETEVSAHSGPFFKDILPDCVVLARMAVDSYHEGGGYDIANAPQPLYLREAEVSVSKRENQPVSFVQDF